MQRIGEKQTQCSESAFSKLVQEGAEWDFENVSLWTNLALYSHVCYWSGFLKNRAHAQPSPLHLGVRGIYPLNWIRFLFPLRQHWFLPFHKWWCRGSACVREWVSVVISVFAVPSYVCWRHLSVSGKLWVKTSPAKLFSSIGKYVKQRETLPPLLKKSQCCKQHPFMEYSTFPCATPDC